MLTDAEINQYHEHGFVIPDFQLGEDTLVGIRAAHERLIEAYPFFTDYCPAVLPFDKSFANFARNDDILDMVSQLIGGDVALWNSSFFAKPAKTGSRTPWHQDGQYWAMRPLATCTVWIAVDDATIENGCLRFMPGSHKDQKILHHQINNRPGLALNQEVPVEQIDESKAFDLVLKAGQVSLHDVYLLHGSEPNRSDRSRRGMTLRFMPTGSHYDRKIERELHDTKQYAWATRDQVERMQRLPLYLMRGIDQCGLNDFEESFAD